MCPYVRWHRKMIDKIERSKELWAEEEWPKSKGGPLGSREGIGGYSHGLPSNVQNRQENS